MNISEITEILKEEYRPIITKTNNNSHPANECDCKEYHEQIEATNNQQ